MRVIKMSLYVHFSSKFSFQQYSVKNISELFFNLNMSQDNETINTKFYLLKQDNFVLLLARDWIPKFHVFPNLYKHKIICSN